MGLNVAPQFDEATQYSFAWNNHLMETDLDDIITCHLKKADAVPMKFFEKLKDAKFIIFYDHGNEDSLIAQGGLILINKDEAEKFKDKQVYTMACLSAKGLGLAAYKKGCKEYWGAIEPIGFTPDEAELFEEVYNMGAYMRFKEEKPIQEVLDAMTAKFDENIDKAKNPWTKIWLRKDRDIWRCWSDETPPTPKDTTCPVRAFAVKTLGPKAWKIPNLGDVWRGFTRRFS